MKYNEIIRNLREDNDLKPKDICDYLEIAKNTYYNYEKGERLMPFDYAIKLSEKYKVSLDYLAGRTSDKGGIHSIDETEQELLNLYAKLSLRNKYELIGRIKEIIIITEQEEKEIKNKRSRIIINNFKKGR